MPTVSGARVVVMPTPEGSDDRSSTAEEMYGTALDVPAGRLEHANVEDSMTDFAQRMLEPVFVVLQN
jgi:hypothetical protein